jgi:hypothetical protein
MVLSMVSINVRVRVTFFSRTLRCDRRPRLFGISPGQDSFDALQLETQLPVKQDLLEHEQLRLFVDSVAVRLV